MCIAGFVRRTGHGLLWSTSRSSLLLQPINWIHFIRRGKYEHLVSLHSVQLKRDYTFKRTMRTFFQYGNMSTWYAWMRCVWPDDVRMNSTSRSAHLLVVSIPAQSIVCKWLLTQETKCSYCGLVLDRITNAQQTWLCHH